MSEPMSPSDSPYPIPDQQMPRCCPRHEDWPTLSEHLLVEFSALDVSHVIREVRDAKAVVTSVGLKGDDALEVGELIARQQLALRAGHRPDIARLDPERHARVPMER